MLSMWWIRCGGESLEYALGFVTSHYGFAKQRYYFAVCHTETEVIPQAPNSHESHELPGLSSRFEPALQSYLGISHCLQGHSHTSEIVAIFCGSLRMAPAPPSSSAPFDHQSTALFAFMTLSKYFKLDFFRPSIGFFSRKDSDASAAPSTSASTPSTPTPDSFAAALVMSASDSGGVTRLSSEDAVDGLDSSSSGIASSAGTDEEALSTPISTSSMSSSSENVSERREGSFDVMPSSELDGTLPTRSTVSSRTLDGSLKNVSICSTASRISGMLSRASGFVWKIRSKRSAAARETPGMAR